MKAWSPNHWTTRELPLFFGKIKCQSSLLLSLHCKVSVPCLSGPPTPCPSPLGRNPSCTLRRALRHTQGASLCPHDAAGVGHRPSEATVAQSCPALYDAMDCSPPVSSVHGLLQPRRLERLAVSSSRRPSRPRNETHVSCVAGSFFTT